MVSRERLSAIDDLYVRKSHDVPKPLWTISNICEKWTGGSVVGRGQRNDLRDPEPGLKTLPDEVQQRYREAVVLQDSTRGTLQLYGNFCYK